MVAALAGDQGRVGGAYSSLRGAMLVKTWPTVIVRTPGYALAAAISALAFHPGSSPMLWTVNLQNGEGVSDGGWRRRATTLENALHV
jgi:hypothetical protein